MNWPTFICTSDSPESSPIGKVPRPQTKNLLSLAASLNFDSQKRSGIKLTNFTVIFLGLKNKLCHILISLIFMLFKA